jgi:hypothetical protein
MNDRHFGYITKLTAKKPLSFTQWGLLHCLVILVVLANLVASKEVVGGGVKAKSSQVPDMFLKEFPIAFFHFHPICLGKCCSPFTHIGVLKGRISILQNRTFYFGEST